VATPLAENNTAQSLPLPASAAAVSKADTAQSNVAKDADKNDRTRSDSDEVASPAGWNVATRKKKGKNKMDNKDVSVSSAGATSTAPVPASNGNGLQCTACHDFLSYDRFHKSQQKRTLEGRKCIQCREAEEAAKRLVTCSACNKALDSSLFRKSTNWDHNPVCRSCKEKDEDTERLVTCSACNKTLDSSLFRKSTNWDHAPVCRSCKEKAEDAERLVTCSACNETLDSSLFRKSTNWDHDPTCRSCTEKAEDKEYAERLEQWRKQRESMTEAEARSNYAETIAARVREVIPANHDSVCFEHLTPAASAAAKELWANTIAWAKLLAQRIEAAEVGGQLDGVWRKETPSRAHAMHEPDAAGHFKSLEDLGDELVQQHAGEMYLTYFAGERVEKRSVHDLRNAVMPIAGERSWDFPEQNAVIVSVCPDKGWPPGVCSQQDLRAEPRTKGGDRFMQFDQNAYDVICSGLGQTFAQTDIIEVKLIKKRFWEEIEEDLYNGRAGVGSHNQTFTRLYGYAAGGAQGSNWTEVMNLFSDVLGLYDGDPSRPSSWLSRAMWSEHFGHLFEPRLKVCYGSGAEFRADNLWHSKMEANVAEALIGALSKAGLDGLAHAAVCLCLLCYVAWPQGVLPSNWAMAEKRLAMERTRASGGRFVNDEVALVHVNIAELCNSMERWLAA